MAETPHPAALRAPTLALRAAEGDSIATLLRIAFELPLQGQEIAPGEALLRRLAQEIGRVQGRQQRNTPLTRSEIEPASSEFQYAFRSSDQALRRDGAEANEKAWLLDFDGSP